MNCAGDDSDAFELDFNDFWTPWELLDSYYAEDYLEVTFNRLYGTSLEHTPTGVVVFDPASN